MKRRYWWIIGTLVLLALIIPLTLLAQSQEVPPPPPFPSPGIDTIEYLDGKLPTATPNAEEAEKLPKVEPPMLPTAEMIDTAPDSEDVKYEIIIERGDGSTTVLQVPVNIKPEEVVDKYLKRDEGDTYYVAPPPHAEPPEN